MISSSLKYCEIANDKLQFGRFEKNNNTFFRFKYKKQQQMIVSS